MGEPIVILGCEVRKLSFCLVPPCDQRDRVTPSSLAQSSLQDGDVSWLETVVSPHTIYIQMADTLKSSVRSEQLMVRLSVGEWGSSPFESTVPKEKLSTL